MANGVADAELALLQQAVDDADSAYKAAEESAALAIQIGRQSEAEAQNLNNMLMALEKNGIPLVKI